MSVVIGHSYGFPMLYQFGDGASTSLINATGFISLAAALFLSMGSAGLASALASKTSGGLLLRRFAPICLFVPFIGLIAGFEKTFSNVLVLAALLSFGLPIITYFAAANMNKAEKSLLEQRHTNHMLARIVETSSDAITSQTLDRVIVSWNQGAENLYGYSSSEAVGQNALSIMATTSDDGALNGLIEQIKAGQSIQNVETTRRRKDGNLLPVRITCSPILDESGNVVGMSTFERDITAQKLAESRVSEFFAMVSHELRTPLTSIHAALRLIQDGLVEGEDLVDMVNVASGSSNRLLFLINDILDLKKIESGEMDLQREPLRTEDLLTSAVQSMYGLSAAKEVSLQSELRACGMVCADQHRIMQVFANLVSNAIKFSPQGSCVRLVAQEAHHGVRFCVIDQGIGIHERDQGKLFQKFQQIDSAANRKHNGTGLGLAVSKAIVELHGGTIGVDSEPGKGSTFWFELPNFARIHEIATTDCRPPAEVCAASSR